LGTELYCPVCGTKQIPSSDNGSNGIGTQAPSTTTGISATGDVIGSAISGMGNIIGKEVKYSVSGNVINLHVDSISTQKLQDLYNAILKPSELETKYFYEELIPTIKTKLVDERVTETRTAKAEASQVLKAIDQIAGEKGIHVEEIKVGDINVSHRDLMVRDAILEGNELYYAGEYVKAVKSCDKAITIDKKNAAAWYNKGNALHDLTLD
jgi:hypothetical protein